MKPPTILTSEGPLGLGILIQCGGRYSNTITTIAKPTFRLIKFVTPVAVSPTYQTPAAIQESSFLKFCHLCNKRLSLKEDVYMYRGDQGFCSIECRCRQIHKDEIKELEAATRKMLASSRKYCRSNGEVKSSSGRPILTVL